MSVSDEASSPVVLFHKALQVYRVNWLRAKAWMDKWQEEVTLVQNECQDVEWCTALLNQNQEGFRHWLQLMCCAYLVLLSKYFRCVLGTLRIPEVLEVVWELEVIQNWSFVQGGESRGQV